MLPAVLEESVPARADPAQANPARANSSRPEANALGWRPALVLLALFLLSGATSLVYQVLWVRQLSLILGSTIYAISAVVSAFMAGLALGSAFFGARADRWGHPLRLYGVLEGGIGLCALGVPAAFGLIARAAATGADQGAGLGALAFVATSLVLLVPTALMGGTLPVLARYVAGFRGSRGKLVGLLYSLNTAGAILGAGITGFVLIRAIGVRNTTVAAAVANLMICVAAVALSRAWPEPQPQKVAAPRRMPSGESQLLGAVTVAYFVNGLVGLGLELLWTRAVMLFSGNTIYAFTVILTTFLIGIVAGSSIVAAAMERVRNAPALLGGLQCGIGLIAGLTPLGLAAVGVPLFQSAQARAAPLGLLAQALSGFVVSVLFMLPATVLLGASFPLVARVAADYTDRVGRAVGRVYALNTVGAVLGSLLSAFVFLPWIGIQRSILLFALLSAVAGVYVTARTRAIGWTAFGAIAVLTLAAALGGAPNHFRAMLEKALRVQLSFYAEGVETTVGVYPSRKAQRPVLLINNVALDDHGVVHKLLAHIPALLHPDPKRVLVVGFGVGITSQSFAAHGVAVNDCVEISADVMRAAPQFAGLNGNIAGRGDASFHLYVADGRRLLLARGQTYDILALDANSGKLRNAGVGKLYTREFFELCRSRLAPDGMITVYASPNTTLQEFKMIVRTFREVFPHTSLWIDPVYGETCVLLGTLQPLRIDLQRWLDRLQRPAVQADLAVFDLDAPGMLLSAFLMGEESVRLFSAGGAVNTDDHPIMEFYSLRMNTFDIDDHPLLDLGLPLYREPVLGWVESPVGADAAAAVREYVNAEQEAFANMRQAWLLRQWSWTEQAADCLQLAAAIHPEAEHLRSQLGHGRRDFARAMQAAGPGAAPEALARAATIAARRDRCDVAVSLFDRALARAGEMPAVDRAAAVLEAARCALRLGQFDRCRAALVQAEQLGEDVRLDRAELLLAEPSGDLSAATQLLHSFAENALSGDDWMRAFQVEQALRARGRTDPRSTWIAARCLEAFGDPAGALAMYRELLSRNPTRGELRDRSRICALEIALRLDAAAEAHADTELLCSSLFTGSQVPAAELPDVDHRRADAWLELSDLYLKWGRPLEAYRKARSARALEPAKPETYLAVGQAASRIGGRDIARIAFARALELDGKLEAARTALRQLSAL